MKLVFLDSASVSLTHDISFDHFKEFVEVVMYDRTEELSQVAKRIGDSQIIFTNKVFISNETIDKCANLKYIGVLATGTNVIEDMDYVSKKGITVTNIPAYSSDAVAQGAFAHMLNFSNRVAYYDSRVKASEWQKSKNFCFYNSDLFELGSKTLGIIGYGNIARKVASVARVFNMKVVVYTRTPNPCEETEFLRFTPLDELLEVSDIVSLHCPLNEQTFHIIDKDAISKLKPSLILVNTARGDLVDEYALSDALNGGKIVGYGADVVSKEPIEASNPLLTAKNCVLTPHIAWAIPETRLRLIQIAYENVKLFLKNKPVNKVNN